MEVLHFQHLLRISNKHKIDETSFPSFEKENPKEALVDPNEQMDKKLEEDAHESDDKKLEENGDSASCTCICICIAEKRMGQYKLNQKERKKGLEVEYNSVPILTQRLRCPDGKEGSRKRISCGQLYPGNGLIY